MNKLNITLLISILCIFAALNVQASTLKNLYEVGVPVMSQGSVEQKQASKDAFEILLVRITGRRDLAGTEIGRRMIENARQYVSSFRYEVIEEQVFEAPGFSQVEIVEKTDFEEEQVESSLDEEGNVTDVEEEAGIQFDEKPTQKLVVSFDERAVKGMLWKQKLPVWGKTRPSTLLWVAIQDANQRLLLDANESTALLAHIQKHAEKRGVPMLFPLLDLEDQINLNVTDVWGAFKEPIKKASIRYQPEAILSARLFLDPFGVWQTRWTLHQGDDEVDWQVAAVDLETAVVDGIDQLADKLAQQYAHISSAQDDSDFLIYVTDVNNLADFVKVNKYLSALSSIKRAEVAQVKGNELVFKLDLRSSASALKQAINLGKVLFSAEDPFAPEVDNSGRLIYRLMP